MGVNRKIKEIQLTVAQHFGVRLADLKATSRARSIARPRMIAMWLIRDLTEASFPEIGRAFERDHTTVISAVRRVQQWAAEDDDIASTVSVLKMRLEPIIRGEHSVKGDAFVDACRTAGVRK